jgi:uncharacterized protein
MKSPASSFPAERTVRRWYREPWPWFLMAGPMAVIIASLASAWLAIVSDDGVVAQDYYKQGLTVNQRIKRAAPSPARPLGATIDVVAGGNVRVRIEGLAEAPRNLRLKFARPHAATREQIVRLEPDAGGDYVGTLAEQASGRWIVTLESDAWRLPTTAVEGPLSRIVLGTAERKSETPQ